MDDLGEPNVVTWILVRGRQEDQSQKGNGMTEASVWSGVRKGSPAKECRRPLKAKKSRKGFDSEASRRNKPCQHLELSLVQLILDFWPPELYEYKCVLF